MRKLLKKVPLNKGFTLIELLIVVAIIAALAIAVFVALNPGQRLIAARDARRTADVDTILTAIHTSIVDNNGTMPAEVTTTETQIGTSVSGCTTTSGGCSTAAACVDLATGLTAYLKSNPIDPSGGIYVAAKTGYSVVRDANNIVTVRACGTQGSTNISASR